MKRQVKKILFATLNALLVTSLLGVGVAYAWFPSVFEIGHINFAPGTLDDDFNYSFWNKAAAGTNKWQGVSIAAPLNVNLGEMITIDALPSGTENYFQFKTSETNNAQYTFAVILEMIEIKIVTNSGTITIVDVEYYESDPSQKVFDYYYVLNASDNLVPTTLFANPETMTKYQVTTLNQNLTGSAFAQDQNLYVMMVPRLKEVQNIIDRVPIALSPYAIEFNFTFLLEKRTIDEI